MTIEATASALSQPVSTITAAATITAADPARSPMTSRYAARRLRLRDCASLSSHSERELITMPAAATASITSEVTCGGAQIRTQASMRMKTATPNHATALTAAARISRRR